MNRFRTRMPIVSTLLLLTFIATRIVAAQAVSQRSVRDLVGPYWQLVRFQGGDGTTLTPDPRAKYTISFATDGRVTVRIDCNRGNGTWRSAGANQLEFGPLALTRVMCPPGSLHDRIVRHWPYVRSYTMRNGHLFLSLMADGGIYEFEPMTTDGIAAAPVRGTATYRERIALPANAVFEATLEDVSRAGAPAELIARVRNEQPGNPPIPFTIAYDAGRIDQRRSYAVRARILVDDRLWFTTDQNYPVLTAGDGSDVQLLLRRANAAGAARPAPRNTTAAALENTYWKLIFLGNSPIVAPSGQREPHFILHPANRSVTGFGGCNRLTGSYELRGDRISFRSLASTMMACVGGMEQEQDYLRALGRVSRWRITGQTLELFDAAGTSLARFGAVYTQ
jgi:putative lipoprotein